MSLTIVQPGIEQLAQRPDLRPAIAACDRRARLLGLPARWRVTAVAAVIALSGAYRKLALEPSQSDDPSVPLTGGPSPASGDVTAVGSVPQRLPASDQPVFHILSGDQNRFPGGTYALGQRTSAFSIIYEQPHVFFGGQFGLATVYVNEGFLGPSENWLVRLTAPLHYRDAYSEQLDYWWPGNARCRLGASMGPEIYFDTTATQFRSLYSDRYGIGLQMSVTGQCHVTSRIAVEVSAGKSLDVASFNSRTVMLGLAYSPGNADNPEFSDYPGARAGDQYVEIATGRSELDDFRSELDSGWAEWLDYGESLGGLFGFDVSLRHEQVHRWLDRTGVAGLFNAHQGFGGGRVQFFAAIGPELALTDDRVLDRNGPRVDLLAVFGVKFHLRKRMFLLLQYGRVAEHSEHGDTDFVMTGVGVDIGSATHQH
jgi:hypothetical protein